MQANLRLSRILELAESGGAAGADGSLDVLLDLLDAVRLAGQPHLPVVRRWWHLLSPQPPPADGDRQAGLLLAAEQAIARLFAAGIHPVDAAGAFDPLRHRAIDIRVTDDANLHDTIAVEHRRGWVRIRGESVTVVRLADVTVNRRTS